VLQYLVGDKSLRNAVGYEIGFVPLLTATFRKKNTHKVRENVNSQYYILKILLHHTFNYQCTTSGEMKKRVALNSCSKILLHCNYL